MVRIAGVALGLLGCATAVVAQQQRVTTPMEEFGHNFGDDYFLANYQQLAAYWRKLDAQSDRMMLKEIGRTAEGRPHLMAIVTSSANHARLEHYRSLSERLARAEGLTEEDARALAREGKSVVWIDGGLHASETLGAQQLGETVYQFVSGTDPETMRILDEVIILFVHANPDGNDLVADWYMRRADPQERSSGGLPRLYQKYIGHDNNRDFFASTQAETENMNRVLYHQWFPQLLYNHHQSGPQGTVLWSPPLRDPYNFNLHPMIVLGFQQLGAAMHGRLAAEGKPGATMRSGGPYDGWWNGGIRNTAAFHNTIALLTEMIGNPTPMRIPFVASRQLPSSDLAYPIEPQVWHFRQSIDYSVTLNRAVLDYAARMRENLLYNMYVMGKTSIDRGNRDTWTMNPKRLAEVSERFSGGRGGRGGRGGGGGDDAATRDSMIMEALRAPELRDPRAYILSADQPDFATAAKFISALRETGITVHRATREFTVQGKSYPAGSFVVFAAQSFRPHVIDMFEPQVHPDVFPNPGGPPTPPYDNAGWTLAMQMGVRYDRILEGFTGPFERVTDWNVKPLPGTVTAGRGSGFVLSRASNNAYVAVNRLLAAGVPVSSMADGSFHVSASLADVRRLADSLGVSFTSAAGNATGARVRAARVGLWDQYGGSMDSGWARWILEQFEFPFERVFAQQLDAGNLNAKYDLLVFVDGGIPGVGGGGRGGGAGAGAPDTAGIPREYHAHLGRVTAERTMPRIREFVERGGTVVAIGSSAQNLAAHLNLPIEDHLTENGRALTRAQYFTPGSLLMARVDNTKPATSGMADSTIVFFDNSPVFRLRPGAETAGVTRLAWFDSPAPLRSGWSWGQQYLNGGVVALEAKFGRGRVLLYGPEILKRAQPHGTFRFLFNALYTGAQP